MSKVRILIEIDGEELSFSMAEAKEIYKNLHEIFGQAPTYTPPATPITPPYIVTY